MPTKQVINFSDLEIHPEYGISYLKLLPKQKIVIKGDLDDSGDFSGLKLLLNHQTSMDIYVDLTKLRSDIDLYAFHADIDLKADAAYVSSTNSGISSERIFTRQKANKETLLQIRQNNPHFLFNSDRRFKMVINPYKTGQNPNIREPDDEKYYEQWHLFNGEFVDSNNADSAILNHDIGAPEAWKEHIGSRKIITAIIDTGVDLKHPDLIDNLWVNDLELNGIPGEDDDSNGYVDDVHGWSFAQSGIGEDVDAVNSDWGVLEDPGSRGEPNGAPRFTQARVGGISHGTHVAGIIGARGNNGLGVCGVNWKANLMALNAANDKNRFHDQVLVEALHYALDNGAKVINLSLGGLWKLSPDELMSLSGDDFKNNYYDELKFTRKQFRKVLKKATKKDALIIHAVGNDGDSRGDTRLWGDAGNLDDVSTNNTWSWFEGHPNLISVASVDPDRRPSPYTNFGTGVDIAAPGGNVMKTQFFTDPVTGRILGSSTSNYGILSTVLPSNYGNDLKNYDYAEEAKGEYEKYQGTSMAAPVVSGAATLIWSKFPGLSAAEVKQALLESATMNPYLLGYVENGRDLNLGAAMSLAKELNGPDIASIPDL